MSPHSRAFTIVELLVSISVIFILITALFVAFKAVRQAADRTDTSGALRQMIFAYNSYSNEHKGRLMPGYVDQAMIGAGQDQLDLVAKLSTGFKLDEADTQSYVWRLAPYVDNVWQTYMTDYRDPDVENRLEEEFKTPNGDGVYGPDSDPDTIGIAEMPSIGLNSIYAGGDTTHGGGAASPAINSPWLLQAGVLIPNPNKIAAVRQTEVKNPPKFIIFAPSQQEPPPVITGISSILGYCELRPPIIKVGGTDVIQWQFATTGINEGKIEATGFFGSRGGWILDRTGADKAPVANLDGSVTVEQLNRLAVEQDRWNPFLLNNN
jgi:type II secretory pathway pseudopilin PulG